MHVRDDAYDMPPVFNKPFRSGYLVSYKTLKHISEATKPDSRVSFQNFPRPTLFFTP